MIAYYLKSKNGEFIGVDQSSGWRPYETLVAQSVKLWTDLPTVIRFMQRFPSFIEQELYSVHFNDLPIPDTHSEIKWRNGKV